MKTCLKLREKGIIFFAFCSTSCRRKNLAISRACQKPTWRLGPSWGVRMGGQAPNPQPQNRRSSRTPLHLPQARGNWYQEVPQRLLEGSHLPLGNPHQNIVHRKRALRPIWGSGTYRLMNLMIGACSGHRGSAGTGRTAKRQGHMDGEESKRKCSVSIKPTTTLRYPPARLEIHQSPTLHQG